MEAIPRVDNPTPRRAICLNNGLVCGSVFIILAAIVITACYRYWQSEIEERIHQRLLLDDDGKEVLVVARIEGSKRHQGVWIAIKSVLKAIWPHQVLCIKPLGSCVSVITPRKKKSVCCHQVLAC